MTDARSIRRRREQAAMKAARRATRAQGCTCSVELDVIAWTDSIPQVAVRHDPHCPLLRIMQERHPDARAQVVITTDPAQPDAGGQR